MTTSFEDMVCGDDERRAALRLENGLYGIDFLEVRTAPPAQNQLVLELHFLDKAGETLDAFLDSLDQHPEQFLLTGGVRVRGVRVANAERVGDIIAVTVSEPGDFSQYRLRVNHPQMDPVYAEVVFSFKAGCPSKFDCKPIDTCDPPVPLEPAIDYMAKDYASFRQALLDRISLINPDWRERRAADLGIAMAELFAYAADHLSYYQDAVANEAYLETARQRISVRRHARMIDYRMHDGLSARAFIQFDVATAGEIPSGTQLLTRITSPYKGKLPPHPNVIIAADAEAALDAAAAVFEIEDALPVDPKLTGIPLYAWQRRECCLPAGTTSCDLFGDRPLEPGDLLLLEEVKGLATGKKQDADPTHRQVVRLTEVVKIIDPLPIAQPTLTRVVWDSADALTLPFCLSFTLDGHTVDEVVVAHGNVGIANHGKRIAAQFNNVAGSIRLDETPLAVWLPPQPSAPVSALLLADPRQGTPAVAIANWKAVEGLLDSDPDDAHFVTEIDNNGRGVIRFGDGVAGRTVSDHETLDVEYRVGLGPLANVSPESIVHVIDPGNIANFPVITAVRNPLPAAGGTPPEPIDDVKLTAPASLRTGLQRAVTEDDYARVAEEMPEISRAVATSRWTGTWHTVFLTVDTADGTALTPELRGRVDTWVRRFMQTGYDLKIDEPVFAPLEVDLTVCTDLDHFRSDVLQTLLRELGTGVLAGGRRAFFNPDQFTFGQPLFLSQLYAAVTAVEGVRSARVTKLQRFGKASNGELAAGSVRVGRTEVIRCDNDPNFAERGILRIQMEAGK